MMFILIFFYHINPVSTHSTDAYELTYSAAILNNFIYLFFTRPLISLYFVGKQQELYRPPVLGLS